jgi:hypothetical protein
MSKLLLKTFACCALSINIWSSNAWSQTTIAPTPNANCQNALEVVPVKNLSAGDLANLGPELTVARGNYAMTFWHVEPDNGHGKLNKATIGFSLIQTRDIESQPVGLIILSNKSEPLDFVKDGHQIMIASRHESSCPIRAILSVTETGGIVLREMSVEKPR